MVEKPIIDVVEVEKEVAGRRILDRISLHVRAGEVVGFIGPNGAGKTSLIRILAGLSRPTGGTIVVCGRVVDGRGAGPPDVGLVPEAPGFVEHLSGLANLRLLASIRGVIGIGDVRRAMSTCGLDPDDNRSVAKYSLGMRQRLSLAQAIMERPRALLLDEPTNGLDVVGITDLRGIIRLQAESGVAILLASHLLSEVERACDRVLVVTGGRLRRDLTAADLRSATSRVRVGVSGEGDWQRLAIAFSVQRMESAAGIVGLVETQLPIPELNRQLVAFGINVEELSSHAVSLEQVFLKEIEVGGR